MIDRTGAERGRPRRPSTNWEGTGVEPDVKTQAAEALAAAHSRALAVLVEKATDPRQKAEIEFARGVVEDRSKPPASLSSAKLQAFAGTYGPRTITQESGALWYQRGKGHFPREMTEWNREVIFDKRFTGREAERGRPSGAGSPNARRIYARPPPQYVTQTTPQGGHGLWAREARFTKLLGESSRRCRGYLHNRRTRPEM